MQPVAGLVIPHERPEVLALDGAPLQLGAINKILLFRPQHIAEEVRLSITEKSPLDIEPMR
eukprot:8169694-Lingulodinium_polyedra.AAC.1